MAIPIIRLPLPLFLLAICIGSLTADSDGEKILFGNDRDFMSRIRLNSTHSGYGGLLCQRNWSPRINGYVTCCQVVAGGVLKCLPSIIIAGVQKGGTTALSALLCSSSSISFSKKKEVHFFDNLKKFNMGIAEYLRHFHEWNYTSIDQVYPLVYGESTPFYLASREACERISKTVPDVRIVVLLREPVSRAYSEYQMKKRRVESQEEFVSLLSKHVQRFNSCFSVHPIQQSALLACLPSEITKHSHYKRLLYSLTNQKYRKRSKGSSDASSFTIMSRSSSSMRILRNASESRRFGQGVSKRKGNHRTGTARTNRKNGVLKSRSIEIKSHTLHKKLSKRDSGKSRRGFPLIEESQIRSILGRYAAERLPPLNISFGVELREWERCAGPLVGPGMTVESLDAAVVKCLEGGRGIRMGIGRLYFYRSLYAVQLNNCFKHIPRSQFLILSSEQLQREPDRTVDQILRFIGVLLPSKSTSTLRELSTRGPLTNKPTIFGNTSSMELRKKGGNIEDQSIADESSVRHRQFIRAAVDKYFPTFESSSGWKLCGNYSPLPVVLQSELKHFFKPYNDLLSKLLDTDLFNEEWAQGERVGRNGSTAPDGP